MTKTPADEHVAVAHDGNVWRRSAEYGQIRIGHVQKRHPERDDERWVATDIDGSMQMTRLRRECVAWLTARHLATL